VATAVPTVDLKYDGPPAHLRYKRRVGLFGAAKRAWASREIVSTLAERQLRARYAQSLLGFAWAVISPVALMVAFTLVFERVGHINTAGAPYALFSYLGLLPWTFFSGSVTAASNSIISNVSLINKIFCPREVFPLGAVAVSVIDAGLATLALLLLFPLSGFTPKATTYWVPLAMVVILLTTLGWSMIAAVTTVYLRDVRNALPLVLQLGLFVTPVAYGFEVIPSGLRPVYSVLHPLGPGIDTLRRAVLFGKPPDWSELGLGAVGALLYFIIGYAIFKRMETGIADVA